MPFDSMSMTAAAAAAQIAGMGLRLLQEAPPLDSPPPISYSPPPIPPTPGPAAMAPSPMPNVDYGGTAGGHDTNSDGSTSGGGGNDAYEFIAFLLWYVFLVLCCVIPTCCAYRRRRQVEARMAQQQTNMDRWQATNMFIVAGGFRPDNNVEHVQAHRTKYLEQELRATTMVRDVT
jgi:hypothetical protein